GARVFRAGVPPRARLPDPSGEPEERGTLGARRHGGGATHRPCRARGRDRDLPPARVSPGPRARDPGASVAAEGGVVPARHQERRRGRDAGSRGHPRGAESVHDARASATAGSHVDGGAETRRLLTRFEEVSARLGEPLEVDEMEKLLSEQARLQDQIDAANAWDLDRTVELAMDALRVPPGEMEVAKISGGERRRVALCRLLLSRPDMLLLDEPTNHLDAESVAWLERFLKEYPGT